jgi:hypothetical protein
MAVVGWCEHLFRTSLDALWMKKKAAVNESRYLPKPSRFGIVELALRNQDHKILTDRAVGILSRAENLL